MDEDSNGTFRQIVQETAAPAATMAEARSLLMQRFPELDCVGVEEQGPNQFGVCIRNDGDPKNGLVNITCMRTS